MLCRFSSIAPRMTRAFAARKAAFVCAVRYDSRPSHAHSVQFPRSALNRRKMMAIGRGSTCPMTITRLTMETRRLMTICQLRRGAPLRSIVSGRILQRCRCAAPPPHNRISPRSLWRISSAGSSRTRFPYRRTTPIPTTPHRQNPIARLVNHSDGMHLSSLRPCSLVVVHPRSVGLRVFFA